MFRVVIRIYNDVSYSNVSTYSLMSFFGILDYNFDNRYFLSASVREDGCSKFGEDNKWGLFYSVGLSWNMHNEAFMKDVKWLQTLPNSVLSYGVNGNNNISNYSQYGVYSSSVYNGVTGLLPSSPANKKLSWEKNKSWNFGIDFRFLQNASVVVSTCIPVRQLICYLTGTNPILQVLAP
jgi:hypothetical protein